MNRKYTTQEFKDVITDTVFIDKITINGYDAVVLTKQN